MADGILKVGTITTSSGSGTITLGQSGETVTVPSGATITNSGTATGFGGGITEADMFRLTATITANVDPISSNLERCDDATFAKIGTGVTNSSGVFSFGATGLYKITNFMSGQPTTNDNVTESLYGTSDNGSSLRSIISAILLEQILMQYFQLQIVAFFNCTNVSTHKVKFAAESITNGSEISGKHY